MPCCRGVPVSWCGGSAEACRVRQVEDGGAGHGQRAVRHPGDRALLRRQHVDHLAAPPFDPTSPLALPALFTALPALFTAEPGASPDGCPACRRSRGGA